MIRVELTGTAFALLLIAVLGLCQPVAASEASSSEPPLLDPSSRLADRGSASEYWDLTMRLDSGHAVFARFLITNTGPGDGNAVVTGQVVTPEGSVREFQNGRRKGRWELSADGRRMDVGSSHLDLREPEYRLEIAKKDVKLDLRFAPTGRTPTPPEVTPAGYRVDLLASSAPVRGTLWLKGMARAVEVVGQCALVHTGARDREADLVLRRIEVFSLRPEAAFYLLELLTPAGRRTHWLNVHDGKQTAFSTTEVEVAAAGDACEGRRGGACSEQSKYWVPRSLGVGAPGLQAQLRLERVLAASDPLEALPGVVRWLVALTMRPHRVWAETVFDVTLSPGPEHPPFAQQGSGVTAVTFLNTVAEP